MGMRACSLLAMALAIPAWAGEPFLIPNDHPIGRLFGPPAGDDAVLPAPTGFQARVAFDLANTSIERIRESDALVLDGETWVARLNLRHGWKNGWRVALQVPVVSHQGGGTDAWIEDYHAALGLPQGNRKRLPPGRLEYRFVRAGETRFDLDEAATGVGDVRFSAGAPLWRDAAETRALDAVAGVELPTGDSARLLGSGSTDFSLGLAACDGASLAPWNLELHGSAGLLAMTPGEVLTDWQETFAGYGALSIGWEPVPGLMPRLQFDGHSPFFADTGQRPLDNWAAELVVGATVELPAAFALDLAVAEDIAVNTAPDVVFHISLKRSL